VRSHFKKAQVKLGARNRAQAPCEALRQYREGIVLTIPLLTFLREGQDATSENESRR
jgi:hypothetical protein